MNIKKENLSQIAIQNSMYSVAVVIASKVGGFVFTIILARLLLPELFGIYSLALSVVLIAVTLTDLGADLTGMRFMSKALARGNNKQARSYFRYILKIKAILILIAVIIILAIAKPLAQIVFNKPLVFLPLVFSCFFLIVEPIRSFFSMPFPAKKDIKIVPPLELSYQFLKIVFVLIAILFLSYNLKVAGIFLALAISGFLSLLLIAFSLIKKYRSLVLGDVIKIDKKRVLRYMGYMGLTGITLIFFGSIDTLMLGRFVDASYLGYYRVAFILVVSIAALLPFSGILLPIFTQIHGKRLDRGFQKSLRYLLILALPMSVGIIIISKYIILVLYGKEYLPASITLMVLSPLIIISPLILLYSTIFQAKEKPKLLANSAIISLLINISLNYFLIKILLGIGQNYALIGAGIATLVSNIFFLTVLIFKTNSNFKIKSDYKIIPKSAFATAIMAVFLLLFMRVIEINILSGAIMIFLAAIIYFSFMFLIKGLGKEDILLVKTLFKR
jgi:O-antigen/teichoic acid export membrane protein